MICRVIEIYKTLCLGSRENPFAFYMEKSKVLQARVRIKLRSPASGHSLFIYLETFLEDERFSMP